MGSPQAMDAQGGLCLLPLTSRIQVLKGLCQESAFSRWR